MVITLCGSTKFRDDFFQVAKILTLEGHIVLMPMVFHHSGDTEITEEQKEQLDILHKKKIDMSDCIVVIDVDNYIGKSTKSEIVYAEKTNKAVHYWSKIVEGEDEL